MPDVIIIGAGISGLTAAHRLARTGKDVLVLEEGSRAGGKIVTEREEGYLLESGPNSLRIENQETIDLIKEVELEGRVMEANLTSQKRYVLKRGHWVQLPRGPVEALTTPLLSIAGKLRILGDMFVPQTTLEDESAASFIRRRLGKEILDYGADPFITGIYAGDPDNLSMRYAFGSMWRAEQEYGSLIWGMMKARSNKNPAKIRPRVISFPEGLSELTSAVRAGLADRLQLHAGAIRIEKVSDHYHVTTSTGSYEAANIVLALPAYDVATMIEGISADLAIKLREVFYPPVAVVFLGYDEHQFETPPAGFGGLIPSKEQRNILGVIYSSSNFPNRAPVGHLLFTVLLGGAKHPEIAKSEVAQILDMAVREFGDLLKPRGEPAFRRAKVWNHAIPQYNVGYGAVLKAIERTEAENPGLHFLGNYRGGISMGACIKNATELAKRLV